MTSSGAAILSSRATSREFIDCWNVRPRAARYFSTGLPFVLVGPRGIGKTTLVEELAGDEKKMRTVIGSQMLPSDLIGGLRLDGDRTYYHTGILIECLTQGLVLYADELTGFSLECLRILHPILDHRRTAQITIEGKSVKAHPDFRFVASCNHSPTGIDPLTDEFRDRLIYIHLERAEPNVEMKLLMDRHGISPNDAEWLIRFAIMTRNVDAKRGASTRQLETAATAIANGVDRREAAMDCVLSSIAGCGMTTRDNLMKAARAEGLEFFDDEWLERCDSDQAESILVLENDEVWS